MLSRGEVSFAEHFGVMQEKTSAGKLQNPALSGTLWATPEVSSCSQESHWFLPTKQKKFSLCAEYIEGLETTPQVQKLHKRNSYNLSILS